VALVTEQTSAGSSPRLNPLKRVSKELFQHGQEHSGHDSPFDRLVAGVHVDNALELFLKSYGAKNDIHGYKQKLVPELITILLPHITELAQFGADLRIFHDIRDVAYHMGLPLDDVNLNWGIETIKSFCDQVEQREKREVTTLTDGGVPQSSSRRTEAQIQLEKAIALFQRLPFNATKEQLAEVLMHMFRAVELWVDGRLCEQPRLAKEEEISTMSLGKKIDILRQEIKDSVLLIELRRINDLRNATMHSKEVRIAPNEVYKYLQIVMHFVEVESPSRYGTFTEGRDAEEKVKRILEKHPFAFEKDRQLEGYSRKSRFDFVLEKEKIIIEIRHSRTLSPSGGMPDIFVESLAFRIVDLKRIDERWKFIIVLSGHWSKRSEDMLRKYSDCVVRIEDFETVANNLPSLP
jgi:hypothetical protein